MKNVSLLSLAIALAFVGSVSAKDALVSGPQEGDRIGAFYVTKCAGASDDGVEEGKNLCYRCKNGSRPQVMVFTRSTDAKVIDLVKKLDAAIGKNEDAQLKAFVNLMGDSKEDLNESAKDMAAKTKASHIPFVVPNEFENGPDNYGINAKAAVTVVMAGNAQVKASYAVADAKDLDVDAVVANLSKILQ
ncbi:hypothetical protein Poly24_14660 [Rosistilla carotiformis]|uniref:Secreted protein n=1 Tax=Rosistilla carotiformis TaxID=2528017 RepID=A0A518JQE7_9BACT|nr:hypothetical protein [Rosistilla carotiformis]QDV67762.1 hypothetical protein Poly24_14660 [Rosistilla carotiformis]